MLGLVNPMYKVCNLGFFNKHWKPRKKERKVIDEREEELLKSCGIQR